ncbi:unnamed protein product, partial [Closterium sp. Naga37s-1]
GLGVTAGVETGDHDVVEIGTDPPNATAQDSSEGRAGDQECIHANPDNVQQPSLTPTATDGTPEDLQPRSIARASVPRRWPNAPNVDEISEQRVTSPTILSKRPRHTYGMQKGPTLSFWLPHRIASGINNAHVLAPAPIIGRLFLVEASARRDVCRLVANDTWYSAAIAKLKKETPLKFPLYPSLHFTDAATPRQSSLLGVPGHFQLHRPASLRLHLTIYWWNGSPFIDNSKLFL